MVADELARRHPKLIVSKMTKALRHGKVFIDWSQNADYKTTVGVYSLRVKSDTPYVSMPVKWEELARRKNLYFEPDEALARLAKLGDLFAPVLTVKQRLQSGAAAPSAAGKTRKPAAGSGRRSTPLPKPNSQSGRRLFLVVKGDAGSELWTEMRGRFKRWILRPDREGGDLLIALPAGDFAIDPEYYRGEVPKQWKSRIAIEDAGSYEVIEGSYQRHRFDLWFNGRVLSGEWILEKVSGEKPHRSWRLRPVRRDEKSSSGSLRSSTRLRAGRR
jgi:bifunctional non-homologous end joining protein LigD